MLLRCLLRLQPNPAQGGGLGENIVYNPLWSLLLQNMTFGLKNAGATYQRCIQNFFKEQIGRNVHAYVDDVVIKSHKVGSLIDDLRETFANLRRYKMKLNPTKLCLGFPQENSSVSSFLNVESRLTRRKSRPYRI